MNIKNMAALSMLLLAAAKVPAATDKTQLAGKVDFQRQSCDIQSRYFIEKNGKEILDQYMEMASIAKWRVAGKTYSLKYFYGEKPNEVPLPILYQSVTFEEALPEDRGAKLTSGAQRLFAVGDDGKVYEAGDTSTFSTTYQGPLENGQGSIWTWKNGKKGKLAVNVTVKKLSDGSFHQRLQYPKEVIENGISSSDVYDCVSRDMSFEAWIALTGDPKTSIEVEGISTKALLANEADRKFKDCKAHQQNCEAEKAEFKQRLAEFQKTLDKVFSNRKSHFMGLYKAALQRRKSERESAQRTASNSVRESILETLDRAKRASDRSDIREELEKIREELERIKRR